jgi:hypothetical protein
MYIAEDIKGAPDRTSTFIRDSEETILGKF